MLSSLLKRMTGSEQKEGKTSMVRDPAKLVQGMTLDEQQLDAPHFHSVDWSPMQRFTQEDDPDRMRMAWTAPSFVSMADPAIQAKATVAEEIVLPEHRGPGTSHRQRNHSFARVVHNVLTPSQCAEMLRAVNTKGFTPALVNTGGGSQQLISEYRDGWRAIVDSPEFSSWLMEVLRPHLPTTLPDATGAPAAFLSDLNERCRVLCYTPGQKFDQHCDGRYCRPKDHPKFGDHSRVTVQMYLHDVPKGSGGATTFFPGLEGEHACQPVTGSVLLFTQDLLHEGSQLHHGIKYTIRTEAMYSRAPRPCGSPQGDGEDEMADRGGERDEIT